MLAHIEWTVDVLRALQLAGVKLTADPKRRSKYQEVALRAHRNRHGIDAIVAYMHDILKGGINHKTIMRRWHAVVEEVKIMTAALKLQFHLAFDEMHATLRKLPGMFLSQVRLEVATFTSGSGAVGAGGPEAIESTARAAGSLRELDLFAGFIDLMKGDCFRAKWTCSMCGTELRLGSVPREGVSVVRKTVTLLQSLHVVSTEDIDAVMRRYLDETLVNALHHRERMLLERLKGRPSTFFRRFWGELIPSLQSTGAKISESAFRKVVRACAVAAFEAAAQCISEQIDEYWESKAVVSGQRVMRVVISDLYACLILRGGVLQNRETQVFKLLMCHSILCVGSSDDEVVTMHKEPAAVKALRDVGDRHAWSAVRGQDPQAAAEACPGIQSLCRQLERRDESSRGQLMGELFAAHLLLRCREATGIRGLRLSELFRDMLPPGFRFFRSAPEGSYVAVSDCANWTLLRHSSRGEVAAEQLLNKHSVVTNVENPMGSDILLPVLNGKSSMTLVGTVAVHCKCQAAPDLWEMLGSLSVEHQFVPRSKRQDDGSNSDDVSSDFSRTDSDDLSVARRRWLSFVKNNWMRKGWVPALYRVRPWGDSMVNIVNEHNSYEKNTPNLLLQATAEAFGVPVFGNLSGREHCMTTVWNPSKATFDRAVSVFGLGS